MSPEAAAGALIDATEHGHVTELILERSDVDINEPVGAL